MAPTGHGDGRGRKTLEIGGHEAGGFGLPAKTEPALNPNRRDASQLARFTFRIRRGWGGASAALATTDGRWALVSTSMTALVAGAIAWMAMGVTPVDRPLVAPGRSSLPYALFMKLIRASEPQIADDNADN